MATTVTQKDILKKMLEARQYSNIPSEDILQLELDSARDAINNRRNYVPTDALPMETKYYQKQLDLAISSISRYGAEGQVSHNENGVSRSYENGSKYPASMLSDIIPLVGVI